MVKVHEGTKQLQELVFSMTLDTPDREYALSFLHYLLEEGEEQDMSIKKLSQTNSAFNCDRRRNV